MANNGMVDPDSPGVIDGRFEVLSQLGEGGMGVVYRALHRGMDREVAIKLLKASYSQTGEHQLRFRKEAQVVSTLNHPNIVSIYSVGITESGAPYIAMELLDGRPLSEMILERVLPWRNAVELFVQACAALEHAHNKGIIHRDIKPSNLVVLGETSRSPRMKVVDFGVAKVMSEDSETRTNVIVGSALYLSPSRCAGGPANPQSDIYSVGCSLFEVLAGRPPLVGEYYLETIAKHRSEIPPAVNEVNPAAQIPDALEKVIACCLTKETENGYQSVSQLRQDLQRVLDDAAPINIPVQQPSAPIPKSLPKLPWKHIAATLATFIIAGGAATAISHFRLNATPDADRNQQRSLLRVPALIANRHIEAMELAEADALLIPAMKQAIVLDFPFEGLKLAEMLNRSYKREMGAIKPGPARDALAKQHQELLANAVAHAQRSLSPMSPSEKILLAGAMFVVNNLLAESYESNGYPKEACAVYAHQVELADKIGNDPLLLEDACAIFTKSAIKAMEHREQALALKIVEKRIQLQARKHWKKEDMLVALERAALNAERRNEVELAVNIRKLKADVLSHKGATPTR